MKLDEMLNEPRKDDDLKKLERYDKSILGEPEINLNVMDDSMFFVYGVSDTWVSLIELDDNISVGDAWKLDIILGEHKIEGINQYEAIYGSDISYILGSKHSDGLLSIAEYHMKYRYIKLSLEDESEDDKSKKGKSKEDKSEKVEKNNE